MNPLSTIPSSPEAEFACLSTILTNPQQAADLVSQMHVDMFYKAPHRIVFEGFKAMLSADIPMELMAATEHFFSAGTIERVGGAGFLSELYSNFTSPLHFNHYTTILSDRWKQRQVIHICQETHTIASGLIEGQNVDDVLAGLTERVLALSLDRKQHTQHTFTELCDQALDRFEEAIKNQGQITGTTTGFNRLDDITGGHIAGQLWVIGGGTSDGKSALDQQICLHKAQRGVSCAIYTFEMPDTEVVDRFYASHSELAAQIFKRGFQTPGQQTDCMRSHTILRKLPLTIRDVAGLKLSPLIADIRTLASRGIKHFSIDYAQLVEGDGNSRSREEEIAKVSRTLKATAKQLKVSINLLSQLNDDGKLRESRALGFDADIVLTLSTPTTQKKDGKTTTETRDETKRMLHIGKNRNGQRNVTIPMSFDGSIFTFKELKQPN